jgi:TolB-like protein/Tfp pilus assembly protein PilF
MPSENMDSTDASRAQQSPSAHPDDLLASWKEIASYLKRDVRTVRRWEANQGLPVRRHQHQKGASVYAYRSELDLWWKGEKDKLSSAELKPASPLDAPSVLPGPDVLDRLGSNSPAFVAQPARSWRTWTAFAIIALALVSTTYWLTRSHPAARTPPSGKIMLAVLPFQNLTGDPSQDFVSDGLTEEMSTQISQLQHDRLGVIARTSAMAYKGTTKPVSEIASDLAVDYVLEGSVRRWGDRARISAQLIDAHSQTHVWAQNYESDQHDILKLQNEMAQAVAQSIDMALLPLTVTRSPANPRPVDPEAHDLYLEGRFHLNLRSRDDLRQSVEYFQKAVTKDPGYAAAYAGLADAYNLTMFYGFDPSLDSIARAKAAALKVLQLDPSLSAAHAALAYSEFMWQQDWPDAEREFRRALALDDNDVPAHHWYALYLAAEGRLDEALNQMQYAKKLDPLSPAVQAALAYVYYFARDYGHASEHAQTALQLNPNSMAAHAVLGWTYTEQKKYPAAIAELEAAGKLSGGFFPYRCSLARVYVLSGDTREAGKILASLKVTLDQPQGVGSALASVYLALGDSEKALHWLEQTGPGDGRANWLRVDPAFDSLHGNPRFAAVLRRIGKPTE